MLVRHRQLLVVVALLSWVTPGLPEELEKKKKKHHHHHKKHHVAEDANGTAVVNRSSGEKHKHSHHRAALIYHGNSSMHPLSSNSSARLAGDNATRAAAHAEVAASAPPRTVAQPAVAQGAVEATTSAPAVARLAAEAARPVRHAAAPARATAAAESAAKPMKVAAAGRGAEAPAAKPAAPAEPTKAPAAAHAGVEPAKAAAPTRASTREASAAAHPATRPAIAAETPAPKRKALAATTAAVARAASPKAKESEKTRHKKAHSAHKAPQAQHSEQGQIVVGGPLPPDFEERFVQGVVQATGVSADLVKVLNVQRSKEAGGDTDELIFSAPHDVVQAVQDQASDPESKLAKGALHIFLIDRSADGEESEQRGVEAEAEEEAQPTNFVAHGHSTEHHREGPDEEDEKEEGDSTPVQDNMIDIDTEMPYGDLEPFGREDTAQELTDNSIKESDEMVDQLERAEVAEEKRAVFRALTRLRGAAITSFDGIARSQTGNIDEYNKRFKWRESHPLHHLADEESDVNKWAFPEGEDC